MIKQSIKLKYPNYYNIIKESELISNNLEDALQIIELKIMMVSAYLHFSINYYFAGKNH